MRTPSALRLCGSGSHSRIITVNQGLYLSGSPDTHRRSFFISSVRLRALVVASLLRVLATLVAAVSAATMVRSFPRPVIATSTLSLFSAIIPVSAHVKIPFRPRAHAAVFQQRSPNDVGVEFARRGNVSREVRKLTERGLLDDTLGVVTNAVNGGVTVVTNAGNGLVSVVVNNVVGGGTTTTTPNPPANSTPAPTPTSTQGSGGGNTGNPGVTTTNGAGNPTTQNAKTTQNTQSNGPSVTASNPSQQTSNTGSGTRGKTLPLWPTFDQSEDHKYRCKWFYWSRWHRLTHKDSRSIVSRFLFVVSPRR